MNFYDADNKELMEEAIAGFQHKRGRFWQHGFSQRRWSRAAKLPRVQMP
jgi:hypothetical protein